MFLSMPGMLKTFKTMLQAHVLMPTFGPQVVKQVSKQSKKPYISVQQCAQKLLEDLVIRSLAAISSGFQVDLPLCCDDIPCIYFYSCKTQAPRQQALFISQLWKPEVQDQCVRRLCPLWKQMKGLILASPSFHGTVNPGVSWLAAAVLQCLPPLSLFFSLCLCGCVSSSYRNTHHVGLGPLYSSMTSSLLTALLMTLSLNKVTF